MSPSTPQPEWTQGPVNMFPNFLATCEDAALEGPATKVSREQLTTELARIRAAGGSEALGDVLYEAIEKGDESPIEPAWERPMPLSAGPPLPEFPVDALPSVLRNYVKEVAATRKVPLGLPAMIGLAVLAAAGARRFEVQVGSLVDPICLWTIVGAEPGERKSAAFTDMIFPLRDMERELVEDARERVAMARNLVEVHETRLKRLRTNLAKAESNDEHDAAEAELDEAVRNAPEVPALPRLTVDDVTPERLASILAENDGCMALMSSEGGVFGMMGGRYNDKGGPNIDIYLKGHSGDSVRVDRADGRTLFIPRTALSMALTVQPEVIRELGKSQAFRHRGLPARGLYALPRSLMGTRTGPDPVMDYHVKEAYGVAVRRILEVATASEETWEHGRYRLHIKGDAHDLYRQEADRVERALGPNGYLHDIRDWASKFSAQVARIAAGFHLTTIHTPLEPRDLAVTTDEIQAAWRVAAYLEAHALAAFALMDEGHEYRQATRILAWIMRQRLEKFSRADCYQAVRRTAGIKRSDDVSAPLEILLDHHYIAEQPKMFTEGQSGRPRSATYLVNPATLADCEVADT